MTSTELCLTEYIYIIFNSVIWIVIGVEIYTIFTLFYRSKHKYSVFLYSKVTHERKTRLVKSSKSIFSCFYRSNSVLPETILYLCDQTFVILIYAESN